MVGTVGTLSPRHFPSLVRTILEYLTNMLLHLLPIELCSFCLVAHTSHILGIDQRTRLAAVLGQGVSLVKRR